MSQAQRLILMGLKMMERFIGSPRNQFIWNGETFACVPNSPTTTSTNIPVGYADEEQFQMEVRLNQFTSGVYPELNQFITYQGNTLQIFQIKVLAHGVSYIYSAKTTNANL